MFYLLLGIAVANCDARDEESTNIAYRTVTISKKTKRICTYRKQAPFFARSVTMTRR